MIEIQVKDLFDGASKMQEIMKKNLKSRPAFLLARIIREIEKEYETFQAARKILIEKYGEKDESGNLYIDKDGNNRILKNEIDNFNRDMTDLLNTYVQLNVSSISLNDLEGVEFTPEQMLVLEPFIVE